MKKNIVLSAILVLASSAVFAFPAFNKNAANKTTDKATAIITAQKEAQEAPVTVKGTLLEGDFTKDFLRVKILEAKDFTIQFFIDSKDGKTWGNIAFSITAKPSFLKQIKVVAEDEAVIPGSYCEPDDEANISVKVQGKNIAGGEINIAKVTTVTLKDVRSGNFNETPLFK